MESKAIFVGLIIGVLIGGMGVYIARASLLSQIESLEVNIGNLNEEIETLQIQVNNLERDISLKNTEISELEAERNTILQEKNLAFNQLETKIGGIYILENRIATLESEIDYGFEFVDASFSRIEDTSELL